MIALDVAYKDKWELIINLHLSNDKAFYTNQKQSY